MKVSVSTRLLLCFAAAVPLALTAACGQKGALYLPPRNGTVVTRPAGTGDTATPATGSKQSGKKTDENNSQNPQTPKQP